jgi:hypothetical protein
MGPPIGKGASHTFQPPCYLSHLHIHIFIHSGTFSVVYKAHDMKHPERVVALKRYQCSFTQIIVNMTLRELRCMNQNHANVCAETNRH